MDILVDTSVWIDFLKGTGNSHVACLERLLHKGEVGTCPAVLMEVLQGIRSDSACKNTEKLMTSLAQYPIADTFYLESAWLYRHLRKNGLTIRKSLDCLIAVVAINNQLPLLYKDRDFDAISKHSDLICFQVNCH